MSEAKTGTAPDGGWGWVIVGCSFTIHFLTGGTMFTLGVLYVSWLDAFGSGKGVTSWIISLGIGLFFCVGAYAMLGPVVTVDIVGVSLVGEAYGFLLFFVGGACMAGPPLAGWIVDWTDFTTSYIINGFILLLGALLLLPVAYLKKCRRSE